MSLENNTQEQTTSFQFNNYLKAGAVSMLTLGAYAIARATNFLPQWRTQSGAILTEVSQKPESDHIQLLQNAEVSVVQSHVDVTSSKSTVEELSEVTGDVHPTGLAEFKEIALEIPQAVPLETQKTETTNQRRLLSQTTVLKPIPNQVINANELYDFSIDVNEIFGPGMQALAIMGMPTWMNPNHYPLVQNYRLPEPVNAITVEGTRAYVADGASGLYVLDITNPSAPVLLGNYDTPGTATKVVVSNDTAYVADRDSLQILNVGNPGKPTYLGSYFKLGTVRDVALDSNWAYVIGDGLLQLLDISDVLAPSVIGHGFIVGVANQLTIKDGIPYIASSRGVYTYNYVAPALPSPMLLGQYTTPGSVRGITIIDKMAYIGETSSNCLQIIHVENPVVPTLLGQYAALGSVLGVIPVVGTVAYVTAYSSTSNFNNGLQIVDVTNSAAPALLGRYAIQEGAFSVVIVGTTAYLTSFNFLRILNVTNPVAPTLLGSYATVGYPYSVIVRGTTAYLVEAGSGLIFFKILNVANPAAPLLLGQCTVAGFMASDIAVVDATAYVPTYAAGLHIIDVANPVLPILLSSYATQGYAYSVAVVGTTAYVTESGGDFNGLQIINVANSAMPTLLYQYSTTSSAYGIAVVGTTAYVGSSDSLSIIRIENLINLDSYPLASPALRINIVNDTAIIAVGNRGIEVLSLLNTTHLTVMGSASTEGAAQSITQVGVAAYVSEGDNGFQIFNMANPRQPSLIGAGIATGSVTDIAVVSGSLAYIAGSTPGIQILDLAHARLQGIPALFNVGDMYTFTVTATDELGNLATNSFTVTVARFPVVFQVIVPPNAFWANKPISFTLSQDTFVDLNNDPLTYSAILTDQSPLPAWLTFSTNNLTFSGIAINVVSLTTFTIQVTAVNPLGGHVSATFPLVIQPNVPPTLTNQISDQFARVGTGFKFVIPQGTFIDAEGDQLTYHAKLSDGSAFPEWLYFDGNSFSGTPGKTDTSFYATRVLPILLTANDGKFSTSTTFNINVSGTSAGELFIKIALPLIGVPSALFGVYKKRSLLLNRCNKKKYSRLGETVVVGEAYSRKLETPAEEIAIVQAKLPTKPTSCCVRPKSISGCVGFFKSPRTHIPGGQLLPEWLFYDMDTNSLRSRNGPETAKVGSLIIQVKDHANVIREQFTLQILPCNTLDQDVPAAHSDDIALSSLRIN